MQLNSSKEIETNQYELEIAVGGEEFTDAVTRAFKKNAPKIQVPGFRKGKAPRKMIEKMYGEQTFWEDAVNELYPVAYDAAVKESGIEPVDRAEVEVSSLDASGFTFKAKVFVKPTVTVKEYKGLTAEKVISVVTDDEIDAELKRYQERNARIIDIDDRPAQSGDSTVIDFEGFVDDVAFEGGKAEGHTLVLGSGQFIPGFEEQIVGHSVGEEFDVNVSFPEDYQAEELKGKSAVFKVKLHQISSTELPVLDDEFAKDVSEF
ncbi:MAG: trigger factor, partial [Acetanaerobacterium sp.]